MEDVFRGAPPPRGEKRVLMYDVLSPGEGEVWDCTSLETAILGLPCHWISDGKTGRVGSRFCRREMGPCEFCLARHKEIWQGFLGVYNWTLRRNMVLRLGPESAERLARRRSGVGGLHGIVFSVRKPAGSPTAALMFDDPVRVVAQMVTHTIDIVPSVCLVLKTPEIPDYRYSAKELLEREGTL